MKARVRSDGARNYLFIGELILAREHDRCYADRILTEIPWPYELWTKERLELAAKILNESVP